MWLSYLLIIIQLVRFTSGRSFGALCIYSCLHLNMQSSLIFKMLISREKEDRMLLSINSIIFGISLCMKKEDIINLGAILDEDSNYRYSGPWILTYRVGNNGRQ